MKKISSVLITLLVLSAAYASAKPISIVLKRGVPLSSGGTRISLPFDRNQHLSHIDYQYSIADGPFIQNGSMVITYDENGSIIKTESEQKNTDNIINLYSTSNTTIPLNATLYKLKVQTDDEDRNEIYYIDSETGLRHDISVSITTNYNGEPAYVIEKKLDDAGNMIEYAKVESEFDGQGRPVVTVFYSPHYTEQDSMYLDLYKKLEYEYLPDSLVSTTTSYYGNGYWQPDERIIQGRKRFNEYGYTIYQENYSYDAALCAFYLDYKKGDDYIGDSLTAEWGIYYNKPQTLEQLSDPESLISRSYNFSDLYYTEEELGISLSDYPNLELPEKGYLTYRLNGYDNGVYNWVLDKIVEYEYVLVPESYDNPVLTFKKTSDKTYTVDNTKDERYLSEEKKWEYDEYGTYIFRAFYENGSIYDRKRFQYKYVTRIDGDSSYIVKLPILDASSDIYYGVYTPIDSTYYEYDNENRLINKYSFSDWNFTDSIWEEQIWDKITYENNNIINEVYYLWDYEEKEWFDYKKCTTEYYPTGELKTMHSYLRYVDDDKLCWTTYESLNMVKDDAGRIILKESYFYLEPSTNLWISGAKEESTYNDTTLTKTSVKSMMDRQTNDWYPVSKNIEQKNLLGEVILSESYQWDNDLRCWIGKEKKEEEHDINGNVIHSATYEWDNAHKDWRGISKSESLEEPSLIMNAEYTWDDDEWCWQGSSKVIYTIIADNAQQINYAWDKESKTWINDKKIEFASNIDSNTSITIISTESKWNPQESKWILESRESLSQVQNDYGNVDNILIVNEKYDTDKNEWYHFYSTKDLYVYDSETAVESISIDADITVSEGIIYVNAADDSRITIISVAGGVIASGTRSVSTSVVPGIYLIDVDGKTAKVIVRQ